MSRLLDQMRAWPLRKKMNFIWTVTGTVVVILIIAWILVGNFHQANSGSALSNIQAIVNSIKKH
jgi:uncharacterized membrane protein YvbJ